MDYRQAQRNLDLIQQVHDDENDEVERFESEAYNSIDDDVIGTQIPSSLVSISDDIVKPTVLEDVKVVDNSKILEPDDDKTVVLINQEIEKPEPPIFMNTQIQGRLDECEENVEVKSKLSQFKYEDKDATVDLPMPKNYNKINKNKSQQKSVKRDEYVSETNQTISNTEDILKFLSGKHSKIKKIVMAHKNGAKSKAVKKTSKKSLPKFDTYKAEEWEHIFQLILSNFPQAGDTQVKEVYQRIYGQDDDVPYENLWKASQTPQFSMLNHSNKPDPQQLNNLSAQKQEKHEVKIMTLSQVMSDRSITDISMTEICPKQHNQNAKENLIDYEIPDTTDEEDAIQILIPKQEVNKTEINETETLPKHLPTIDTSSTQYFTATASNNIFEGVIDLTHGSFNAVNRLISPVKPNEAALNHEIPPTESVQVTETCATTVQSDQEAIVMSQTALVPKLSAQSPFYYEVKRSLVDEMWEKNVSKPLSVIEYSDVFVNDSEDDSTTSKETILIKLGVNLLTPTKIERKNTKSSPDKTPKSIIASQSIQKLRHSIKTIGLKPVRTKSDMIESLAAASQVLETEQLGQEKQREEIKEYLTLSAQQATDILEKIYTFQPITIEELINSLVKINPFVGHIDEETIREWADSQGVCIRKL